MAKWAAASSQINRTLQEVEDWSALQTGKHKMLIVHAQDHLRLMRLRTWSMRYRVPIAEILDLVMPTLRKQVRKCASNALGVPIKVLIGKASHRVLRYHLKEKYPNAEHIIAWREKEQRKQLRVEEKEALDGLERKQVKVPSLLEVETVAEWNEAHLRWVEQQRARQRKVESETWRRRKHYRGNPWL